MAKAYLHPEYLVQDSRFVIFEDYGCSVAILPTWVALIILSIPPIVLELIAGVYGCLSIIAFYKRSNNTLINNFNFDSKRYRNLILFSVCDLLCGIPVTLFYLYNNVTRIVPFPGIKEEHYDFSYVYQIPADVWRSTTLSEFNVELNRWIIVWGAFVFFAIFGFTEESRKNYQAIFQSVVQFFAKITRIKTRPITSTKHEGCVISSVVF